MNKDNFEKMLAKWLTVSAENIRFYEYVKSLPEDHVVIILEFLDRFLSTTR